MAVLDLRGDTDPVHFQLVTPSQTCQDGDILVMDVQLSLKTGGGTACAWKRLSQ